MHAVALGPIQIGQEVTNVLYAVDGKNGSTWSLWQKILRKNFHFGIRAVRELRPTTFQLKKRGGVQVALEMIGSETQPLLAP